MRKIVMFGDSLTDYFPMEKLKDVDGEIINSGQAGDTIAEMAARISYDVLPYQPDIILMQGGANDFLMSLYPGYQELAHRVVNLALRLKQHLPETAIYVESLYPAYTDRIGMMPSWADGKSNEEIKKINEEIRRFCEREGIFFIDIFHHLIGKDGQLSREYTIDGIHLQDNAYEIVARVLRSVLESI